VGYVVSPLSGLDVEEKPHHHGFFVMWMKGEEKPAPFTKGLKSAAPGKAKNPP
jgi:hypothetical protein